MTIMKTKQKNIRWTLLVLLVAASLLLSACSGGRSRIAASSWPGFSVDGETIYVSSGQFVRALKLENGNQIWQFPVEADKVLTFYAPPVVLDGVVIAGDYQDAVHGLDADTGSKMWTFTDSEKRFIAPGLLVNDLALEPSAGGTVYALNSDGTAAWQVDLSSEAIWAQPVTDGETVYVASMDHSLYALEISEAGARQKWSLDVGGAMVSSPSMDEDGNLYVGTMTQKLVAVSPTGRELWRYDAQGAIWGTPVVHEGQVMFGDLSGTIYALNTSNGSVEWTITVDGPVIGSGVLLADGVAFAIEEAGVQAVSFSGVKNWSHPVDGEIQAGLVQAGDFVLVAVTNGDKLLIALDPANGNERWSASAQ